jgi:DNA replication initiation complex subunit (GINS family)
VGPFEEGNEYELYFWIAQQFVEQGIAHFREEDSLDAAKLYKVVWKERVQIAGQISELPEDFYPKLRRYLANIKEEIAKQPEKVQEYEKAKHLARDIVNSRLKKIVALSSGPAQTDQVLKKFTSEEKFIYQQLGKIINEWKAQILEYEGET